MSSSGYRRPRDLSPLRRTSLGSRRSSDSGVIHAILCEDDLGLSVRLDSETERRLNDLAKATGRTKSHCAREAILAHLEEFEDRYLAIQRLENPGSTVSLEELVREIGLAES